MTKFDEICNVISEIEFKEETAEKLIKLMSNYRETYSRTYLSLRRIPAFRKLWDAIDEAAYVSAGGMVEGLHG